MGWLIAIAAAALVGGVVKGVSDYNYQQEQLEIQRKNQIEGYKTAFNNALSFPYRPDRQEKTFHVHCESLEFSRVKSSGIFPVKPCFLGNFKLIATVNLRPSGDTRRYVIRTVLFSFFNQIVLRPKCRSWTYA
jgi:hypothetical protein